jgi:molybdopterin adenylyltransferase
MTTTTTKMTAPKRNHPDELIIGLVSVSDRASQGVYEDKGIPSLMEWLAGALSSPWRAETRLIQDDAATISAALVELVDDVGCDIVLTTGGTGPARRDVTPEATLAVATKPMPGFGEQMRQISLNFVPTAILSRQVAVIRETEGANGGHAALIINLPGQPKSIKETLEGLRDADGKPTVPGIFAAVPYCIDLIGGPYVETRGEIVVAFRPKSAIRPAAGALPLEGREGKV